MFCIWEQIATCATYSINWLVFITELKSVYCAVRTGPLNKAVCSSSLKGLNKSKLSPNWTQNVICRMFPISWVEALSVLHICWFAHTLKFIVIHCRPFWLVLLKACVLHQKFPSSQKINSSRVKNVQISHSTCLGLELERTLKLHLYSLLIFNWQTFLLHRSLKQENNKLSGGYSSVLPQLT